MMMMIDMLIYMVKYFAAPLILSMHNTCKQLLRVNNSCIVKQIHIFISTYIYGR